MGDFANHIYLEFTIKVLRFIHMWPKKGTHLIKQYFVALIPLVTVTVPVIFDFLLQFIEEEMFFLNIVQTLIAFAALGSVNYISLCFLLKNEEVQALVKGLTVFEKFASEERILATEKHIQWYTKFFIIYGVFGDVFYAILPLVNLKHCNANRNEHLLKHHIPCGLQAPYLLPFHYDYFPLFEGVIIYHIFISNLCTTSVMTITMLVCGTLIHVTDNLKWLRIKILKISDLDGKELEEHVNWCIKYHTAIIDFSDRTNTAFTMMMLAHVTCTGIIVSTLGFVAVVETEASNTLRYLLHLGGWLGMLYIVSYYAQILMDKSFDIAEAVYETRWYEKPPKIRRNLCLMLLRAQRPLRLTAAYLKVMSAATFLGVLRAAYSYFTLLLNMRA